MINRVRRKFSAQGRLVWRERSKDYTGYDKPIREFACRSWIGHISADYTIDDGRGVACCVKGDTIASHIVRSIPDMQAGEGDGRRDIFSSSVGASMGTVMGARSKRDERCIYNLAKRSMAVCASFGIRIDDGRHLRRRR